MSSKHVYNLLLMGIKSAHYENVQQTTRTVRRFSNLYFDSFQFSPERFPWKEKKKRLLFIRLVIVLFSFFLD